MKTLMIKSSMAIVVITMLGSCSDFLDRMPYSNISSIGFYDSEKNIRIAAIGLYGTLQTFYEANYPDFTELPGDNAYTIGGALAQFEQFSLNVQNGVLSSSWSDSYHSILQANKVLESLPQIDFSDEAERGNIEGEARFVRALSYFNLVRMFGKVPLVTSVINQSEARQSVRNEEEEIYALIVDDLTASAALLPALYSGNNIGRATRWAALSLLGSVYMMRQQFDEAITPLKEVVESGPFALLPNFADIFDPVNANHSESIFEIQYEGGTLGEGSRWGFKAHARQLANVMGISTADATLPTVDLIQTFESDTVGEATSPRYLATIGTMSFVNNNGVTVNVKHVKKHYMEHTVQNQSDDNWPLIRYADVLLMYAEALNETAGTPPTEAVELVNQIRRRAFGLPINGGDNSKDLPLEKSVTKAAFREAIYLERRLELAFEGHRWFDLVRTGRYETVMNAHAARYFNSSYRVESFHRLFPVPQREIDINPLLRPNNEGYN